MLESTPSFDHRREPVSTRVAARPILDDVPLRRQRTETYFERFEAWDAGEIEISSTPRWGRDDMCFCGSEEKFSTCHGTAIYQL